ncbi:Hint domain protein [Rubellimicrobium thermophilum DSM 16684]|uniref:Hint domain protein n=1 Tax=Rubellimicrobium thermophilum DSM 16684 TaxID=1123069 RepID=S9SC61_9RHOB|nr:Hint domain-containing protein [Rubellimicrobium thermophilum]EPX83829.1 Hint domain protein [Rubellimicrobium thermophilum DSM 16684]
MTRHDPAVALHAPIAVPPRRPAPPLRRVEIAWLAPGGNPEETVRLVPAIPPFDEAFAAFARGTLIPTARGPVAVEDLWPGDMLRTADGTMRRLVWRGATMIVPQGPGQDPAMTRLIRIAADALGVARPEQDLVLGPHARLVHRHPGIRMLTGREMAAIPAADFVDDDGIVVITPPAPVQVFHLGLERQERLLANGVEVESFHPGPAHATPLRGDLLDLYLSCFPGRLTLTDFGEVELPRLRLKDLDLFDAA